MPAGNQCLSCYSSGPRCARLSSDANFNSCNSNKCNCNSPWSGSTCGTANLGVCWSEGCGANCCKTYCNQCAPGFSAVAAQPSGTKCACTCKPNNGIQNGWTSYGVAQSYFKWSGNCKSDACVSNDLVSIYGTKCGP